MQAVVQSALARAQKKSAALQNLGLSSEKLKRVDEDRRGRISFFASFSLPSFPPLHPLEHLRKSERDTGRVQLPAPFIG